MSSRAGYWFEAMRRRGDSDEVVMTQFIGGKTRTRSYLHAETDGVGALYRFLAEQGLSEIALRGLGASQGIPLRKRFKQFVASFKKVNTARVVWPMRESPLATSQFYSMLFSEDEVARLKKICALKGVNLRVFLLSHFHPYFLSWMEHEPGQGTWMIPVTTRKPEEVSKYENLASYFLLTVTNCRGPEALGQISAAFNREIKSGAYWGTYWSLSLISMFGRKTVRWVSDRAAARGSFMGTFSDLGEWTFSHPDPDLQGQLWASAPPASAQYPIGVSKLIMNGKMSVGFRINRRVMTPSPEQIERDFEQIKQRVLSHSGQMPGPG